MKTPFKLKSGNKPNKKKFFGTKVKDRIVKKAKKLLNIKSTKDALKAIGYSDKDIKGK
tara:strand:- start:86 stop:259 length:174 start_codon:yes stop_codon:yes gene_type:complete